MYICSHQSLQVYIHVTYILKVTYMLNIYSFNLVDLHTCHIYVTPLCSTKLYSNKMPSQIVS